ncbi:hypothetical protein [Leadbetterella byssophila]|uniref:hypothetical protein n=1 Tax=Leadbetterella byssophila TaxID=316068 RepID=UPI0039A0C278
MQQPINNSSENSEAKPVIEQSTVGGDKDEHGCLTAAGETWSQLKQSCIQIFNVGQRLNPIETKDGETVISAFVLFNDDKSEAELFLPNTQSNTILKSTDNQNHESGEYKFDANESTLYINHEKKYKAE